jgi:YD repeat-containing protein
MITMRTFRDENGPGDETRWYYHEPTGLLTNKLYADGKGTAYSYTPDGKLATRTWARGVTTTYVYTNGSSLDSISYSDDTPDVAFQYDRLGRQVLAIVAGVSTNRFVYDGLVLVSETHNGVVLSRTTDALGREQSLSLNSGYQSVWNYDTLGRIDGVAWAMPGYTNAAIYGRITNSDLSAGWSIRPVPSMGDFSQIWSQRSGIVAADPLFAHERGDYDLRGLVGEVANTADAGVFSHHRYDHDSLGRRTARVDSGSAYPNAAFDRYGYNGRSEVVSGRRYYGTDSADTRAVASKSFRLTFVAP